MPQSNQRGPAARLGRFCEKHGEWAANGECRWCEPSTKMLPAILAGVVFQPACLPKGPRASWLRSDETPCFCGQWLASTPEYSWDENSTPRKRHTQAKCWVLP